MVRHNGLLTSVQLQNINDIDKSKNSDSKFVGYLLCALFESSTLKLSSYRGGSSNYNKKNHLALDANKVQLIESIYISLHCVLYTVFGECFFRILCSKISNATQN